VAEEERQHPDERLVGRRELLRELGDMDLDAGDRPAGPRWQVGVGDLHGRPLSVRAAALSGDGHPAATQASTAARRHRVLPPILTGATTRFALTSLQSVRVEMSSIAATSSAAIRSGPGAVDTASPFDSPVAIFRLRRYR
jgi:hypothetical protein